MGGGAPRLVLTTCQDTVSQTCCVTFPAAWLPTRSHVSNLQWVQGQENP